MQRLHSKPSQNKCVSKVCENKRERHRSRESERESDSDGASLESCALLSHPLAKVSEREAEREQCCQKEKLYLINNNIRLFPVIYRI